MKKYGVLIFAVLLSVGCRKDVPETAIRYSVRGIIRAITPDRREVTIQHEAIPGYMDSMTMPYRVKSTMVLDGYDPGEEVLFQLVVTPTDAFIDGMVSIHPQVKDEASPEGRPADNAQWVHIPKIGEQIPDIVLTNQDGQEVRLRDHQGKILVLNFIFTRCPQPTFCPRSMREFKTLRQDLGGLVGKDVELFTTTFDPRHDSPDTLKRYGSAYRDGSPYWQLLTGRPTEVKKAVSFFNVNYWTSKTGNITEHTMSTVLVDRQGRVARFYTGNNYDAKQLKTDIETLLAAH
jgi:protein SCO1/2